MLESFKPIIKNCIDNNKNKTECYYSKKAETKISVKR
jgi:hypothetical protein